MDKTQAIELITKSDLADADKQRLTKLIEEKGFNDDVQKEIMTVIQGAVTNTQEELEKVVEQTGKQEAVYAEEEKKIADQAESEMDQAVSDYNVEMAKLEQDADKMAKDAKKQE